MNIGKTKILVNNPKSRTLSVHGYRKYNEGNSLFTENKFFDIKSGTTWIHENEDYCDLKTKIISKQGDVWKNINHKHPNVNIQDTLFNIFEPMIDSYYSKRRNSGFSNTASNSTNQVKFYFASEKQEKFIFSIIKRAEDFYKDSNFLYTKYKNKLFILPEKSMVISVSIEPKLYWVFNFLRFY